MKLALLGDLHSGAKQDDPWIVSLQKEFIGFFHTECKARGVTAILQTGDWFDVRKGLSQETLHFNRDFIVPKFQDIGDTYVIPGNHDMHKRETITPNSCREVLGHYKQFHILEEATTLHFDDIAIDFIPWICRENRASTFEFIKKSKSEYCVGHFELSGFYFYTGLKSEGADRDFLSGYKNVWSGHFHCQSENDNVRYVGTPYTLTLGDANDSRGFFIFDTETRDLEFVQNPTCWHKKLYFNADTFEMKEFDALKNKAVRVIVEKRDSEDRQIDFDVLMERLSAQVHSLDILDFFEFEDDEGEVINNIEDTMKFVDEYIDDLDESLEVKKRCKEIFSVLHREAKDIE